MPYNNMPIVEGLIQILVATIIFITILRRGKNRLLFALGWLFIVLGILNFLPYLPESIKSLFIFSLLINNSTIISNIMIFFSVTTYSSFQLGMFKGNKLIRPILIVGFFIAFLAIFVRILSLDPSDVETSYQIIFKQLSDWLTYIFFIVSLGFVSLIFISLAWQLRKEKGAMNYITTTGFGLGLMIVAIIMRKALNIITPANQALVDILSLISIGTIIIGAMFQTSFSMSPGFIFDSKTKKPISLATIRIFRTTDDKLLENRITKKDGHYGLLIEPGEYKLDVSAKGYIFPSKHGTYRGESFKINKPTILALDIALDPEDEV